MKNYSYKIINKKNLQHNYEFLKQKSSCKIAAVVKASAYGSDMKLVCSTLDCCDFFCVSNIFEAIEFRSFNKKDKVLVMGLCNDYALAENNNICICVESLENLKEIKKQCTKKVFVHIKINSGMNRLGVKNLKEFLQMIKFLRKNKNIVLDGVFTHIHSGNCKKSTLKQFDVFKYFLSFIPSIFTPVVHVGGSLCVNFDCSFASYVRCGIMLYGYTCKNLKNVMQIKSKIIKKFVVEKNDSVGYDANFVANKKTVVGIIPLGYADGFSKKYENLLTVKINNKNACVIGKICMDMMFVDLTDIKCEVFDEVYVFYDANLQNLTTVFSEYEVLTNFCSARCLSISE